MSYDCCEHEMIAYLILLYIPWLMQNLQWTLWSGVCVSEPQFPPLSQTIRELLTEPDIGSLPLSSSSSSGCATGY